MNDIEKACDILQQNHYTCVFCKGDAVLTDSRRGVKPLLDLLDCNTDVSGFSVADKVVGKAAAYLYCLLGIETLHAFVISQSALSVLREHGITVSYGHLVPGIRNRTDTGPCPMEHAVLNVDKPEDALLAIRKTLQDLS